jgi:ATP phosphoribosyltransferase
MKNQDVVLRLGLPKGRMQEGVFKLLADCGLPVRADERGYRPLVGYATRGIFFEAKVLKPQNIVEMLEAGSRDLGFAGADWVRELGADLVEIFDTGMDKVNIIVAAPESILVDGLLPTSQSLGRSLVVASEYEVIAREWMSRKEPDAHFVRSYGATEVFPPEDADIIIDNSATGSTLRANGLRVVDRVFESSTRLYASKHAMADPVKKAAAESFALILSSVIEARRRVMIEMNVSAANLAALTAWLPCMRAPTVSPLQGGLAFAVKVAAPKENLAELIPEIKRLGGSDIVVTELSQLVP